MMFYNNLKFEDQCDFFSFLGHSLNDIVYNVMKSDQKDQSNIAFDNLKTSNKKQSFSDCCVQHFVLVIRKLGK